MKNPSPNEREVKGEKMQKSKTHPDRTQWLLALCGILGPIFYTIIVIILGFLWPGYNHVSQFMSELGATGAPNAIIMNIFGFILLGILMIAFSFGLYRNVSKGKVTTISSALIVVSGISLVAVAFFPCNLGCVNISFTGKMHGVFATIPGVAMALAPLIIAQQFKDDSRWENYWLYTLVTGIVTAILGLAFLFIVIEGWMGAFQRISMGIPLLWMEVISIRLIRLS